MTEEAKLIVAALQTSCEENGSCPDCPVNYWCHAKNGVRLEDAAADLIESLSEQLEQVTRERDAAVNELVKLEYPIPCESDELGGSEYCEENCRFKYPQKECWLLYFRECGVEVANDAQKGSDAKS